MAIKTENHPMKVVIRRSFLTQKVNKNNNKQGGTLSSKNLSNTLEFSKKVLATGKIEGGVLTKYATDTVDTSTPINFPNMCVNILAPSLIAFKGGSN